MNLEEEKHDSYCPNRNLILFNEDGNALLKVNQNQGGKFYDSTLYFYDSYKRLISQIQFSNFGIDSTIFEYDENGNQTELRFSTWIKPRKLNVRTTIKFDNKKNKLEETYSLQNDSSENTRRIYTYSQFKRKKTIYSECQGKCFDELTEEETAFNGKKIIRKFVFSKGQKSLVALWEYDSRGNRVSHCSYNAEQKPVHKFISKYNKFNDQIKEVFYNGNSKALTLNMKYIYDGQKNWIRKTIIKKGNIYSITNRTIEY